MTVWDKFFGRSKPKKTDNSPFLLKEDYPLEISFAKKFTQKGGKFLFNESQSKLKDNFKDICIENNWKPNNVVSFDYKFSNQFGTCSISQKSGSLKAFKAAFIECEFLISNTGKILLSENQIKHFKLSAFPETIIVKACMNQLVKDVSQGMTFLKTKYPQKIPTNITTLRIKSYLDEEKQTLETDSISKSIYLLFEDK